MVGLKVYKVKDKETYNHLHTVLTGWCFFRNEGDNFYIKAPENKTIKDLVNSELILELHPETTEQ
jgi:hypothetical protein